jgi:hypothetical protein
MPAPGCPKRGAEVHSEPRKGGYGTIRRYTRGEEVRSANLVEVTFEADEVLPG